VKGILQIAKSGRYCWPRPQLGLPSFFGGFIGAVTGVIGKISDDKATEFTAAAGAEKDVLVAQLQANSTAYPARVSLLRGMFWLQFVLMFAYVGPVWHMLLVFLDSCPFLPLWTWRHWFELAPHVVGSWRVPALPGNYGTEEWEIVASLLGIQTAAVGGFMYFLHK
jgi:hypothetical protein